MPVASTQSRKALAVGIAGVVVGVGLFIAVVTLTNTRNEIRLGSDRFTVGPAERLAATIARDGPLTFPDPVSGDRPIWVQHLGDDDQAGWTAFDAQVDGCAVDWDAEAERFVDECTARRYPADGAGLPDYPVTVDDGNLIVDVRRQ